MISPDPKVLLVGASGQLGRMLEEVGKSRGINLIGTGRPRVDFMSPDSLARTMHAIDPSVVINAAAYTNVDKAQDERATAYACNASAPAVLAKLCKERALPLVHISTDYVFDGTKGLPYSELDEPNPINYYGVSKLAGEREVLASNAKALVVRTSWLYSEYGSNFATRLLERARHTKEFTFVADQFGCPTSARDLADALLTISLRVSAGWRREYGGIFHASGETSASWFDFANEIIGASVFAPQAIVSPTDGKRWPSKAERPKDTRLCCDRLSAIFGLRLPSWKSSMPIVVERICRRMSKNG
jgi:dTDP-4-dehydrorhamnose reductase